MMNVTSNQALFYAKNLTLNKKGSEAWNSTLNPLVDMFSLCTKKLPVKGEFLKIIKILDDSIKNDPTTYLKLLKFHRLINNGNGIKWLYYLGMVILKYHDNELYEKVLEWSWQYPKDILRLNRITNMLKIDNNSKNIMIKVDNLHNKTTIKGRRVNAFIKNNKSSNINPSNYNLTVLPFELIFYSEVLLDIFKKVLNPNNEEDYNPMFLKYLGYEKRQWYLESNIIWQYLEYIIKEESKTSDTLKDLIKSQEKIKHSLGSEIRDILKDVNFDEKIFTNKKRRLIKKCFNEHVNLLDNLHKGQHKDGSLLGSHNNNKEMNLILDQLKKSPTLAFKNFEKTIKKYHWNENKSVKQKLISDAYNLYLERLKTGDIKVKTHGLDISDDAYNFFVNNNEFDQSLESKLEDMAEKLKYSILEIAGSAFFTSLKDSFEIVLDISGSMCGKPLQTGLLYMLLLTKVLNLKRLFYFENDLHIVELNDSDYNNSMCNLIKKIYKRDCGCTKLQNVFKYIKKEKITDKNIIIITDGDCDPHGNNSNPFHTAPKEDQNIRYVVVNVKEEKMNFPYLNMDPNVCYVTGNNPKTLNGFIKALIFSIINKIILTPSLVLKYSLELEELKEDFNISKKYTLDLGDDIPHRIYENFVVNIPNSINNNNLDEDESDYSSEEY
jgi:hypothetical protein